MKFQAHFRTTLPILVLSALITSCSLFDTTIHPAKFAFEIDQVTLSVGQQTTSKVVVEPANAASHASYKFTSTNPDIATVSGSDNVAIVTALKPGLAIIKAESPEMPGSFSNLKVTVGANPGGPGGGSSNIPFVSVSSNPSVSVAQNGSTVISASLVNGTELDQNDLTWQVVDGAIAHVFGSGSSVELTGIANGTTQIQVTHPKSTTSAVIIVTVGDASANRDDPYLTASQTVFNLAPGTTRDISASLANSAPQDESNIYWASDNNAVVSVTGQGASVQLSAHTVGSTSIRVTHPNATNTLTLYVTVSDAANGTQVYLTTQRSYVSILNGQNSSFTANLVGGTDLDNQGITWTSQDSSVATVLGSGNSVLISGTKPGQTVIRVTHVKSANVLYISVKVNSLNKTISLSTTYLNMYVGDAKTLSASITQGEITDYSGITWLFTPKDGQSAAVTIAGNGKTINITALTNGEGVITATTSTGSTAQCQITVKILASFTLFQSSTSVEPGASKNVTFALSPSNASILISVSDPTIATVTRSSDNTLTVTGIGEGDTAVYLAAAGITRTLSVHCEWIRTFTIASPQSISGVPGNTYRIKYAMHPTSDPISVTTISNPSVASAYIDASTSEIVFQGLAEGTGSVRVTGAGISQNIPYTFQYNYTVSMSTSAVARTPQDGTFTRNFTYTPANALISTSGYSSANVAVSVSYGGGTGTLTITPLTEAQTGVNVKAASIFNTVGASQGFSLDTRYTSFSPNFHYSRTGGWSFQPAIDYGSQWDANGRWIHIGDGQDSTFWVDTSQPGIQINSINYSTTGTESGTQTSQSNNRINFHADYGAHGEERHGTLTVTVNWGPNGNVYSTDFAIYTFAWL